MGLSCIAGTRNHRVEEAVSNLSGQGRSIVRHGQLQVIAVVPKIHDYETILCAKGNGVVDEFVEHLGDTIRHSENPGRGRSQGRHNPITRIRGLIALHTVLDE